MTQTKTLIIAVAFGLMAIGCASFVNSSQKSIYAAATLADGGMKTYAAYWKDQTNKLGATPELEAQRSNVMQMAWDVGAGISVADKALNTYQSNVGTNTATKEVINALILTVVQRAGHLAAYVGQITGDTNLINAASR